MGKPQAFLISLTKPISARRRRCWLSGWPQGLRGAAPTGPASTVATACEASLDTDLGSLSGSWEEWELGEGSGILGCGFPPGPAVDPGLSGSRLACLQREPWTTVHPPTGSAELSNALCGGMLGMQGPRGWDKHLNPGMDFPC